MGNKSANKPCHCGSGKKYKKCCMREDAVPEDERGLADPGPVSQERKDAADRMMAEEGYTPAASAVLLKAERRRRALRRRPNMRALQVIAMLHAFTGERLPG